MDLRGKRWRDLSEKEKESLHPDIREIMEKNEGAIIVGKRKQRIDK